ncbi:hypothetical protein [Flavobacterium praedii]|uniref:hypothetical protein n=1 Tax=Flavobacterium praedii TaxID=3002900 RepID=UPI00248202E4|nr:hypothetical protein [Flavobacterium praedii]
MKTKILLLLIFVSSFSFSQSVNDYAAVIIPVRYDFLKVENQYRLQTLTKFDLQKAGFVAFYSNEVIPNQYNDRCSLLYLDVSKDSGFMVTKLFVTFKDCSGKVIFKSEIGKSREKDFELAYKEALNQAFESVYALQYKYNGSANNQKSEMVTPTIVPVAAVAVNIPNTSAEPDGTVLFAQPIKNGFQLVDTTPKVVLKAYKTTNPSIYIASKENTQGVMILKDNQWFFEYYEKDTLMSEKITVKF